MKEERDILFLSLSLAAGVALGSIANPSYTLAFLADATVLSLILVFIFKKPRSLAAYSGLMLLCGLFCGLTGGLSAISSPGGTEPVLQGLRERLCSGIDALNFGSSDTGGMIKALVLGDRSSLTPEVKEAFRGAGAAHILALSGLHLGIFYLCISALFKPLGNSPGAKKFKGITAVLLSGCYVLIAGASASLVRAFLFILIREGAVLMYRKISLLRTLLAALMIQLIISPGQITTPGFQLSYLAVAGLAIVYPIMAGWWDNWIWKTCCVSISCQLFTAPVAWLHFRSFPKYFLLANLMALPLATVFTGTAMLVVVLNGIGLCPDFLLTAADWLSTALTWVLKTVSGM